MRYWASLALLFALGCSGGGQSPSSGGAASEDKDSPSATSTATPGKPAAPRPFTHQVKADADYYKSGPQQGSAPDGKIKAGTKVRVDRETGNYSKVETEDGVTGYVSIDVLEPLP